MSLLVIWSHFKEGLIAENNSFSVHEIPDRIPRAFDKSSESDVCEGEDHGLPLPSPGFWDGSGCNFILELHPARGWSGVFTWRQRFPVAMTEDMALQYLGGTWE
ncbi:hypothetical protein TNCV_4653741 [Trichonephila clavipes]|nr:hypothetical protein TNCV_4653741 [Trichonephila clavipes]